MADQPDLLTRRSAIQRLAASLGGTFAAAQLGLLSRSAAAMRKGSTPVFLNGQQFLMVETIVDLIIPETDTPGALAAGAHHFIDLMLAEWASPERQARYVAGLEGIERRALETGADGFAAMANARQADLLRMLDRETMAEDTTDGFFGELKKMVLFAYYSSETGATVELRYQRIPGDYLPCVPIDGSGRAWFWNGYSYGL